MATNFFLGFAAHAHHKNELEVDPNAEMQLRTRNSPEEAGELTQVVLDKIERDISDAGYNLKDVKLLILFSSYRGETEDRDRLIFQEVLRVIGKRFLEHPSSSQLRLIGHTTSGEYENEDLFLKEVSGIGYNGLSLLALVTNLPIGVGRTWGIETEKEAVEQGREMVHEAWVDLNQSADLKEHLEERKTLLVLTKGPTVRKAGNELFLAEGIASFMAITREARIMNVIGGCSADGCIGQICRQFYGKIDRKSELRILENEAVCALIPNLSEPAVGLDVTPVRRIGESHIFHFDPEIEPQYKVIKRIDDKDPREIYARTIYENEAQISREKGSPIVDQEELFKSVSEIEGIPVNPTLCKYGFAFPFANYTPTIPIRVFGQTVEAHRPTRSHEPTVPGYFVVADHEKIQKGTRNVCNMLRENQGFQERDVTFIVSCISRRLVEMMAGCKSNTEAEILKDALASTQVMGFLAYGETSFTHLLQEPYVYTYSCWGITLRSQTCERGKQEPRKEPTIVRDAERQIVLKPETPEVEILEAALPDRISSGYGNLDKLLLGGIPENYAVILTSPSCDERDLLIGKFLETGAKNGEITFHVTIDPGEAKTFAEEFQRNFYLFICNPQADRIIKNFPNVYKLKGIENLTEINIALTSAFRKLNEIPSGPRRICIEIISDVLLHHHAAHTRKWLTALLPELKSRGFTTLALMNDQMHPSEEVHAILGLFEGEATIFEKKTEEGLKKFIKINKMYNQKHSKSELPLEE